MWIDADGVAHTVAIPDPRDALAPALLNAVVAADSTERTRLAELVDEFLAELYEDLDGAEPEDALLEVAIPEETIRDVEGAEQADLVERVRGALLEVPDAFRLDALLVMEDLLDLLDGDDTDREMQDH